MKRLLLTAMLILCLVALIGCKTDNPSLNVPEPVQTEAAKPTAKATETIENTPAPTEEGGYTPTVKLDLEQEVQFNGLTVKLTESESSQSVNESLVCVVNGTEHMLAEGDCTLSYLVGTESGETGLVISAYSNEARVIAVYSITAEGIEKITDFAGRAIEVDDHTIIIGKSIDIVGTWEARKAITILDGLKLSEGREPVWTIEPTEERIMTAKCDIPAKDESGKACFILQGSELNMIKTDTASYIILKDVTGGTEYRVEVTAGEYGIFNIAGIGTDDECFTNVAYSG